MSVKKNIIMKEFNGTDYDILYPKTKVIQIDGFDDSIAKIVLVGSIYWYTSETIPDGFLLCDGSEIGRTDYWKYARSYLLKLSRAKRILWNNKCRY